MVEETYTNNITDSHLLVFDLDGTVVNTDIVNNLAYKEAIQQIVGLDLPIAHSKDERFTREKLFSIIDNLTDLQYKKIVEMKNDIYHKYLAMSEVNACVIGVIGKYINTNKIILATNSRKNRAEIVLHHHGLKNVFDYMFFKEDYKQESKFLHVVNYFGVNANLIFVFENDNDEIRKAIAAGIPDGNVVKVSKRGKYE
tara:strand:+ start:2598 stop:3191 length:594 start_codon:yes stop_codon:yes gene_type:complete